MVGVVVGVVVVVVDVVVVVVVSAALEELEHVLVVLSNEHSESPRHSLGELDAQTSLLLPPPTSRGPHVLVALSNEHSAEDRQSPAESFEQAEASVGGAAVVVVGAMVVVTPGNLAML